MRRTVCYMDGLDYIKGRRSIYLLLSIGVAASPTCTSVGTASVQFVVPAFYIPIPILPETGLGCRFSLALSRTLCGKQGNTVGPDTDWYLYHCVRNRCLK